MSNNSSIIKINNREKLNNLLNNILLEILEEKRKRKKKYDPNYLKGTKKSNKQMKKEINKCAKKPRPKSCYDEWTADKTYKKSRNSLFIYGKQKKYFYNWSCWSRKNRCYKIIYEKLSNFA